MHADESGVVLESDTDELTAGAQQLYIGHNTYGSCKPYEYADFRLPLKVGEHADANMLFEARLRESVGDSNPEAVTLLLYQGEIPYDRRTEIEETKSVDDAYTILVNVVELNYQLCYASNNADQQACTSHKHDNSRRLSATATTPPYREGRDYDIEYHVSVRCGPLAQKFDLMLYEINTGDQT